MFVFWVGFLEIRFKGGLADACILNSSLVALLFSEQCDISVQFPCERIGLESSPVAEALAGLRANEARYFMNKYKHKFTVVPANEAKRPSIMLIAF